MDFCADVTVGADDFRSPSSRRSAGRTRKNDHLQLSGLIPGASSHQRTFCGGENHDVPAMQSSCSVESFLLQGLRQRASLAVRADAGLGGLVRGCGDLPAVLHADLKRRLPKPENISLVSFHRLGDEPNLFLW